MTETVGARGFAQHATPRALFFGVLKVSHLGFGGGLVWARRLVVERQPDVRKCWD